MFNDDSKNGTPENPQNGTPENPQTGTPENPQNENINEAQQPEEENSQPTEPSAEVVETKDDSDKTQKLGKVIPFNEQAAQALNAEEAKEAVEDAIRNLKTAFSDLKKQLGPIGTGLQEVAQVISKSTKEARKNLDTMVSNNADKPAEAEEKSETTGESAEKTEDSDNQDSTPKKEDPAITITRETTAAIAEGFNRLKERTANNKLNLAHVISTQFDQFADANLKESDYTVDENGKRVVKVDGAFVQSHANELIPALVRGTVSSLLKTILGQDIVAEKDKPIDVEKTDESAETPETQTAEKKSDDAEASASKTEDENAESKYRVEFDFATALSNIVKNAKLVPAKGQTINESDVEKSKEILIETGHMTEDMLNGKPLDESKKRLEKVVESIEANGPSEKSPEDIEAIDDKHRRILELSRQFEQNMASDAPNDDTQK